MNVGTTEAIASCITSMQTLMKTGGSLSRYVFTANDGKEVFKADDICLYSLPSHAKRWANSSNVFGCVYLGAGAAKYKDYGENALMFLEFMLQPDGPYKELLPYIIHTNPKEVLADGGVLFHKFEDIPGDFLFNFCVMLRYASEFNTKFKTMVELVKAGHPLTPAFCVSAVVQGGGDNYKVTPIRSIHEPVSNINQVPGLRVGSFKLDGCKTFLSGVFTRMNNHRWGAVEVACLPKTGMDFKTLQRLCTVYEAYGTERYDDAVKAFSEPPKDAVEVPVKKPRRKKIAIEKAPVVDNHDDIDLDFLED